MYIPAFVPFDFFMGSLIRAVWSRVRPRQFAQQHSAVAAGMISGEGVAAVLTAVLTVITGKDNLTTITW